MAERMTPKLGSINVSDDRCALLEWENVYLKAQLEQLLGRLYFVEKNNSNKISINPVTKDQAPPIPATVDRNHCTKETREKLSLESKVSGRTFIGNFDGLTNQHKKDDKNLSCRFDTIFDHPGGSQSEGRAQFDDKSNYSSVATKNSDPKNDASAVTRRTVISLKKSVDPPSFFEEENNFRLLGKYSRQILERRAECTPVGVNFADKNHCNKVDYCSPSTKDSWRAAKLDRQVQTSPSSESPPGPSGANWPPPAVHGSPRRREHQLGAVAFKPKRSDPGMATSSGRKLKQQLFLSKQELAHWVASRPGCRLARAKYNYRPLRDSPNDNPELELSLQPCDFVLIFGHMDEDCFYKGELYDGQQGLVPSNYVEIIPEEEFAVSASRENQSIRTSRQPCGLNSADDPSFSLGTSNQIGNNLQFALPDITCPYPLVDVSNVTVLEIRQQDGIRMPCPRDLLVERQLAKSLLISWSAPLNPLLPVTHYHVCINGIVKSVVTGSNKTKCLIEDVDYLKETRISVRAVTDQGHSPDTACTITVGKGANVSPQDLKVSHVTPTTCQLFWYPSNSNCEHVILLNGLKVGCCPAGISQIRMNGLVPSTMYRCSVRVKEPKAVLEDKSVESWLDFKTLSKIGLPDPPLNVQCELGPQDGTLLVTWQPVTNQPKPPSRAAVSGYLVYADGKKLTEVDSPTGDHVVLRWVDLADDPPIFLTVKARTREGVVSADSNVVRVPRVCSATSADAFKLNVKVPGGGAPSGLGLTASTVTRTASPCTSGLVFNQSGQQFSCSQTPAGGLLMIQPQVSGSAAIGTAISQPMTSSTTSPFVTAPAGGVTPQYALVAAPFDVSTSGGVRSSAMTPASATGAPTAAYYVFHPQQLTQQQRQQQSNLMPGDPLMATTSLYDAENSYLLRHQQQQQRRALPDNGRARSFANRRSHSLNDDEKLQQNILVAGQQINSGGTLSRGMVPAPQNFLPSMAHQRVYVGLPQMEASALPRNGRYAPIGYSDEEWELSQNRPGIKPLMSRYKKKLMQDDNRAFSEPDLRLDPRMAPAAARTTRIRPRFVVALYDYNPKHMSPNPNGARDELTFRKGHVILVFNEKDADGFFYGELNGRQGLVPSNLVVETDREGQQAFLQPSPEVMPGQMPYEEPPGYDNRPYYPLPVLPADYRNRRRPYPTATGDLERWGNYSDPSLSRVRQSDYDYDMQQQQSYLPLAGDGSSARFADGSMRYADGSSRYRTAGVEYGGDIPTGGAAPSTSTHRDRRAVFQKKSHSLDYEEEEYPAGAYGPSSTEAYGTLQSSRQQHRATEPGRVRSVDRYSRERDPYLCEPSTRYPQSARDFLYSSRDYGSSTDRHRRHLPRAQEDFQRASAPIPRYQRGVSRERSDRPDVDYPSPQQPQGQQRGEVHQPYEGRDAKAYREHRGGRYSEPPYGYSQMPPTRQRESGRVPPQYDDPQAVEPYPPEHDREAAYVGRRLPQPRDGTDVRRAAGKRGGRDQDGGCRTYGSAPRRVLAKFDYDPKENSPNPGAEQEELTFRAGDVITIFGEVDDDGFFVGELNARRGLVPSNFLAIDQPLSFDAQYQTSSGPGSFDTPPVDQSVPSSHGQRSRRDRSNADPGGASYRPTENGPIGRTLDSTTPQNTSMDSQQPSGQQQPSTQGSTRPHIQMSTVAKATTAAAAFSGGAGSGAAAQSQRQGAARPAAGAKGAPPPFRKADSVVSSGSAGPGGAKAQPKKSTAGTTSGQAGGGARKAAPGVKSAAGTNK